MWLELVLGFLLIYMLWKKFSKPDGYPPGFWGLPLIGYIPLNRKTITENLLDIRRKHGNGPVVSWRMGTKLVVFIFDTKLAREAFASTDFIDRPMMRILGFLGGSNLGIVLSNGIQWQNSRRFTLHHLRMLGMGKSSLVPVVQNEAIELVKDLKLQAGKPVALAHRLAVTTLNVMWQMVASKDHTKYVPSPQVASIGCWYLGYAKYQRMPTIWDGSVGLCKRYTAEDEHLKKYFHVLEEFRSQIDYVTFVDFMPWLSKLIPSFLLKKFLDESLIKKFGSQVRDIIMRDIADHEEKLDINDPKDYIDAYLIEMKTQENNSESTFSKEDLIASVSDLFGTGSETVSITLQWIIVYITHHPEVQKRLQKEVDEILPKGTLAILEDRQRLPYTEAVIHEVLRHSNFITFGVMHMATRDTHLSGYDIPKGAILSPASFWTNYDPKYWDSPNEFRPERFLDKNGKFMQPKQEFYPFGVGKRQCVGETLARMEFLVLLTALVQSITFEIPPGESHEMKTKIVAIVNLPDTNQEVLITVR